MHFLRKSLLVLIAPFFVVLLFATAINVGFSRIATHPAAVKHILSDSGIYKSVIPGLLSQAKQISGGGGDVNLSNPLIKTAAQTTFNPQFVQTNTEAVLDGVYDWLDGKTPVPDFQIDLTSTKTAFANNVAQATQQQLAGLPTCSAAQTKALAENFDALSATCLPQGITAASAASTLQSNILSGKGFLDNPVITANSIKSGKDSQPVFTSDKVKKVPTQYQRAKKTLMVLLIATVLLALAILFLSSSRAAGLRHIGIPLVVVGILLLVFAWGFNHVVSQTLAPKLKFNNVVLQNSMRTLMVDVEQAVDKSYWLFGGGYVVLGAVAIGGSMYLKRGGQRHQSIVGASESAAPPDQNKHQTTPVDTPKPPAGPKPPHKIKVQ
jgi:hypothetical protein